jgi:hypothetical protein
MQRVKKLRRGLKPAELQVVKTVDSKIDRNIIKEQAAEKRQRQVINKLIRGAEMKKEEAKKALEQLNNNEPTTKREKKQIYQYSCKLLYRHYLRPWRMGKNSSYIPSSSVSARRRLVGPLLSQPVICIMFLVYVPTV